MKKILKIIISLAVILLLVLLIRNYFYQPTVLEISNVSLVTEGQNKETIDVSDKMNEQLSDNNYTIISEQSKINWTGSNLVRSHTGTIDLVSGDLFLDEGSIEGYIMIDMNSINYDSEGLVEHLKSEDFFNVKNYPESRVVINDYTDGIINTDVTIKNITQTVTAPARVLIEDGIIRLNSDLVIDRTRWDVVYNSGSLFTDLGDLAINDMVELTIDITATQ